MLAYKLSTGQLISSFAPTFDAQVKSLAASPDGSRIYAAGNFTKVNGVSRSRIVALDPATGAVVTSFNASSNGVVNDVVASASTVYLGGPFTAMNGTSRNRLAAVSPATGALQSWAPNADSTVQTLVLSPDRTKVVVGGSFTTLNGSSNPGYGLGMVDATSGASLPMSVNSQIRDAGSNSAILSLKEDADGFYGSGYHFGGGGNLEGSFQSDWNGDLKWVEDCHGDTYDIAPVGDVVYSASHKHYCGNLGTGGFPQTSPSWTFQRGTATTKYATGVSKPDIYGYPDHPGQPSPTLLNFFPDINTGTYTGKSQGPWTVEGNSDYLIYGGEFTKVNGTAQQGLVRMATKSIAPNKQGPRIAGAALNPTLNSYARGTVRISWPGNWDRDNSLLTYKVFRGDSTTVIYQGQQDARFWESKRMSFLDTNATPGSSTRYRVQTVDPFGNLVNSEWVTVTVADSGDIGTYGQAVLGDDASTYWRLGEPSGSNSVVDWAGADDTTAGTGVTRGTAGALLNSDNAASTFDGTANGLVTSTNAIQAPDTFSTEAWFKTTSTAGGKIIGFGNRNSGNSSSYDRHTYMDASGRVWFGVWVGSAATVTSAKSYNDGKWHQVVSSLSSKGLSLSIDGKRVASRSDVTAGQPFTGYWRVGGDSSWSGANYLSGSIDEVSIYPSALTPQQVDAHWVASGRTSTIQPAPADSYGKAVYNQNPDLYWRLDESSGTVAADSSTSGRAGTIAGDSTLGDPGVLAGNTALRLGSGHGNVAGGTVVAQTAASNPTTFSEEVWIKTSTTQGGRIIGFGSSGDAGFSSSYDRHIWMLDDGTLRFGVYTGSMETISSSKSYNDGKWHHLVATLGSGGMNFFVDGSSVGTNPNTAAQNYSGYWRLGGDNTWGGNSSAYFSGDVDEAAVYSTVLSPADVSAHYASGSGVVANVKPTAAFTSASTGLSVDFDGSGSSDSDGSVASYAWDFGDGGSSTLAKPTHAFAAGGSYQVTLTVTDDKGATDAVTKSVSVAAANVKPTAAFTSAATGLSVDFDGSGSSDSDGSVASYAWDFGDGGSSTLAKPTHAFAAGGSYQVTLTVTDDKGATDAVTKSVSVAAANVKPTAAFTSAATGLSVDFDGSGSSDSDGSVASYGWDFGDGGSSTLAKPTHAFAAGGSYQVTLTVTDDKGATDGVTKTVAVSAVADPAFAKDAFARTVTNGLGSPTPVGPGRWCRPRRTSASPPVRRGSG